MSENEPEGEARQASATASSEREQLQSLERIESGGIPLAAERRLRGLGERGGSFTSDLSVSDFALCDQLGLRPLSQVMGSSIYQVGFQSMPWPSRASGGFMFELQTLSEAWNDVRTRALDRLAQEAAHVGADAVLGMDLRTGEHDWAESSIEYLVVGTAVRHGKAQRPRGGAPVLSEISVADYAKLAQAGVEPLGIVAWSSVFFVAASYSTQMLNAFSFSQNQELGEFTQGIYSARETVVQRISAQAASLGASGVIGVRISHGIQRTAGGGGLYERGGLMMTFHAIGTAIREPAQAPSFTPKTILDLAG
ncbi:MAG: heavy metal-binding domain-containing protein [Solirubrobacteraceae bacterium]|jgi:uncharacterized protein YbjQ (UPF0145 family)